MSAAVRVLCVGSPFGDDALGLVVMPMLTQSLDPACAEVSCHDRPGVRLLQAMDGAQKVVLVDGIKSGAAPGTLHRLVGEQIYHQLQRHTSTHGFGLADALALAVRLGYAPADLVLHGIELGSSEPGKEVGEAVAAAIPGLLQAVQDELESKSC